MIITSDILASINSIKESFLSFVDFFGSLFEDLGKVVSNLLEVTVSLPDYFSIFLPPPVVTVIVSMVGVAVIFRVVGRN